MVEDFSKTNQCYQSSADAAEGTIRKMFARSVGENAVHGSDSDENALIEARNSIFLEENFLIK